MKIRWLFVVGAVLAAAAVFWAKVHSPDTAYLDGDGWIVPGLVKNAGECALLPTRVTFSRRLDLDAPVSGAVLEVRAMRMSEVAVDGAVVAESDWDAPRVARRARVVRLPDLPEGSHLLEVTVRTLEGPAALKARLADGAGKVLLRTGASWSYTINGSPLAPARPASDPWIAVAYDTDGLEQVAVWGKPWLTWGVAAGSLLALVWARKGRRSLLPEGTPRWLLVGLALAWAVLLLVAARDVTPFWGYDRDGHMEYLDWILSHGTLPYATDGWQMYQPPLYYLLAAGPYAALGATWGIALPNIALAVSFLAAGAFAIGRFVSHRVATWSVGVAILGTTPMAFYVFAYPTNENMCTLVAGLVLLALGGLRGRRIESWPRAAGVGALLGVALLSKATALLLVVPIGVVYLLRALGRRRWMPLWRFAVALASALAVSGWFFARTWLKLGKPIVGNWDPASGQEWWQMPGYRMAGSFLPGFDVFSRPFYVALDSVWSGFLATWAGDLFAGGAPNVNNRPPWNYEMTPVSIALCVLVAGLAIVGIASRVRWRSLRMPRRDAALLALLVVTVLTLVWMTLTVPAYAQAKAFYGLVAIVPLAVFAARGARKVWGIALESPRGLVLFAAPWAVVFAGTFVVLPRADNLTPKALGLLVDHQRGEARALLEQAVAARPDDMNARVMLATMLLDEPGQEARARELIDADRLATSIAFSRRLDLLAQLELRAGRAAEAAALSRRAIVLAPGRPRFWLHGIDALEKAGDPAAAAAMRREALRWHPWGFRLQ